MRSNASVQERAIGVLDEAAQVAADLTRTAREYLSTEQGREVRRRLATALMIAAPILGELPGLRRTAVGRALRFAGVSALVIKGAEFIRDWEPQQAAESHR